MLVVRVELWPGGDLTRAKVVASMKLGNVSNLADTSHYKVWAVENGASQLDIPPSASTFDIKRHNRKQTVWALLEKMARKAKEDALQETDRYA